MGTDLRNIPSRLGAAIRELRLEAAMSQMKLAEKADLTLNYVGEVERGEKLASVDTVIRLGRALGISGSELLKRAGY